MSKARQVCEENNMNLRINDPAPDFIAQTTQGRLHFHEWMGKDWAVLFSHPKAFTRICTGELATLAARQGEFVSRRVKLLGVGIDSVSSQKALADQVQQATGARMNFPIIGDPNCEVLSLYNMLAADSVALGSERPTVRSIYVIAPDKRIRLILVYPTETARNFDEMLRVIDSVRLTELYQRNQLTFGLEGVPVPALLTRKEETSRGFPGFKNLFALLRQEISPF
jgi:thioredoxin-dependent peroxiredoxin